MENIKELIEERMKSNKKLFSEDEVKNMDETCIKLYIIGLIDSKKIYT